MTKSVYDKAWRLPDASVIRFDGKPVGTVAARDTIVQLINYDQIFTRDFVVSAYAYLLSGRPEIVAGFQLQMVRLQRTERQFDCFKPGEGLMPASYDSRSGSSMAEQVVGLTFSVPRRTAADVPDSGR